MSESLEKQLEDEIIKRDYWETKATELAYAVAEHLDIDIGEHSSSNNPVNNALDALE